MPDERRKISRQDFVKIEDYLYEIPKTFRADMRVPARFFIRESMIKDMLTDSAAWQLINVTTLPGIKGYAFAMPDVHQGYGFPIGGVAATAIAEGGVISPGGIGYDINCGVRLLTIDISLADAQPYLSDLATKLFDEIPSGVGSSGRLKCSIKEIDKILAKGAHQALKLGYGTDRDLIFCEDEGKLDNADPSVVSDQAKMRGTDQLGTLGSGNHFLEVQVVDEIFDDQAASTFGLHKGMLTIMIHCGSRGIGHQICTDYVRMMMQEVVRHHYLLPDRELVYTPFLSPSGQNYFAAMSAAANYAWANRHIIAHGVRKCCQKIFGKDTPVNLVYDISHNIGKQEQHMVDDRLVDLLVHRKGATRAFGPGRPEICAPYRSVGQPVLVPGTMGTASYVLVGTAASMEIAYGSSCHGAGRKMSRIKARENVRGSQLRTQLESQGIIVRSDTNVGLAEEAPMAYKDVEKVVQIIHDAHLAHKVARLKPVAVIKGG